MARAAGEEGCDPTRAVPLPFSESRPGGSRVVALGLEVALKVLSPDLYVAPKLYRGYLPTLYPPVDPRFAHPKLLADLRDREQIEALTLYGPHLRIPVEVLFELYEATL